MVDQVFYIRGVPEQIRFESLPEGLLDDLKAILGLSDDKVDELYKHLSEARGFLDPKALLATIQTVVKDKNSAAAVRRVLRNISLSQVERLITSLEERSKKEKDFAFGREQIDRLEQILKKLVRPYPSLVRFEKANRLAKITGQQLETVELICDLRPIFDKNRENIEGMMPYTRLHIVATGEDGLPNSFEAELTHQQVIDLAKKAEKAKSKLEVMCQSVKSWLPGGLPELPLTRIRQKESSNG